MSKTRKPLFLIATIAALAAVVLTLTPASAATQGAGTVVGTVTITSPATGIPTATEPKGPTTYSFGAINITGVFHNAGGNFAGTIAIPAGVQGGSAAENTQGGSGSVNSFAISGSGPVGTISGTCGGTFNRTASIVIVTLTCNASINGGASDTGTVTVVAQFTPTSGNGVTTGVKAASFAGVYAAR